MVTRGVFVWLVVAVFAQRVIEGWVSERHAARMLAAGGREYARGQIQAMAVLHPSWLVAMLIEVWVLDPTPVPLVSAAGLAAFLAGQALRLAAIGTLGSRWSARIITLPNAEPVTRGIYRWLRHPNYLGVVLEIAGLPLVYGAWMTAIVASAANAVILLARIPAEEQALSRDNAYATSFAGRPRFIPSPRRAVTGASRR